MKSWARMWKPHRWMEALRDPDDEIRELLCAHSRTGRPIGSERFLNATERQLSRPVRALAIGRPKGKPRK